MASLKHVFDASVLVKALVPPRRKKADAILKDQNRLHQMAKAELARVVSGETELFIPAIALIEVGSLVRRLTGSFEKAQTAVTFMQSYSQSILLYEDLLDLAIEIALATGCRAADSLYLAAVQKSNVELFTDDQRMHELALQKGFSSLLLREQ